VEFLASVTRAGVDASIGLPAWTARPSKPRCITAADRSRGPSDFGSQQGMLFVDQLQQ